MSSKLQQTNIQVAFSRSAYCIHLLLLIHICPIFGWKHVQCPQKASMDPIPRKRKKSAEKRDKMTLKVNCSFNYFSPVSTVNHL